MRPARSLDHPLAQSPLPGGLGTSFLLAAGASFLPSIARAADLRTLVPGVATWMLAALAGTTALLGLLLGRYAWPRRASAEAHGPASGAASHPDKVLELRNRELAKKLEVLERQNHELLDFFMSFPEQVKNLNSSLEVKDVTSIVTRTCTDMLEAEAVQIFLLNKGRTGLRFADCAPLDPDPLVKNAQIPAFGSPQGWLIEQASPVDAEDWKRAHPGEGEPVLEVRGRRFPVVLAAPIMLRDQNLGLVNISSLKHNTIHQKRLLALVADIAAISLVNSYSMGKVRNKADLDLMTDLANHAHFKLRLANELKRAKTFGRPLSLLMLDVDRFKLYNDTKGHPAGDEVLVEIASILKSNVRRTDLVARYGGEEFAALMIGSDKDTTFAHADQIRRIVEAHALPFEASQPLGRVTISGGVAAFPVDGDDADLLLRAADTALYRSKQAGRNRVTAYTADMNGGPAPAPGNGATAETGAKAEVPHGAPLGAGNPSSTTVLLSRAATPRASG